MMEGNEGNNISEHAEASGAKSIEHWAGNLITSIKLSADFADRMMRGLSAEFNGGGANIFLEMLASGVGGVEKDNIGGNIIEVQALIDPLTKIIRLWDIYGKKVIEVINTFDVVIAGDLSSFVRSLESLVSNLNEYFDVVPKGEEGVVYDQDAVEEEWINVEDEKGVVVKEGRYSIEDLKNIVDENMEALYNNIENLDKYIAAKYSSKAKVNSGKEDNKEDYVATESVDNTINKVNIDGMVDLVEWSGDEKARGDLKKILERIFSSQDREEFEHQFLKMLYPLFRLSVNLVHIMGALWFYYTKNREKLQDWLGASGEVTSSGVDSYLSAIASKNEEIEEVLNSGNGGIVSNSFSTLIDLGEKAWKSIADKGYGGNDTNG